MNINSCLNSASVKMTCEDYKAYMQSEIDAYKEIDSRISTFLSEEESASESITGIKTQMEDYSIVLTTLWVANGEDISDANSLMNLVGDETLDGRLIFREQQEARDDENACNGRASSASASARNATQPGEATRYEAEASYWRGQASAANSRYNYWKKKEQRYDEINAASASLFTKSYTGRNMAYQLLALMRSSYSNGQYNISDDRQQLRDGCVDAIKDGWNTKDGNKDVLDSDKVFDSLNNCEDLNDVEYAALISYLNDMGIRVSPTCPRAELKTAVESFLLDKMYLNNYNTAGEYVSCPFDQLTLQERELYVLYYEEKHPDHAESMNHIANQFEGQYIGWEDDVTNIKFLTYTAEEPYKTLFIEHASEITIADLDYKATQHFSAGQGVFLDHNRMNVNNVSSYNTFFHECSHHIDYLLGLEYENANGITYNPERHFSYTYYYTNAEGNTLSDTLYADVSNRIDEKLDMFEANGTSLTDEQREAVRDATLNMIDNHIYPDPVFDDPETERAYNYVRDQIRNELKGSAKDIYGGYSGNTFAVQGTGGYHSALVNRNGRVDSSGNTVDNYRVYWATGREGGRAGINNDGTGLWIELDDGEKLYANCGIDDPNVANDDFAQRIIDAPGNICYNNSMASEYFAENMAAHMTRQPDSEYDAMNYYYDETSVYFENLVREAS